MTDHELTRDVYYPPINKTHGGLTDEQRESRERRRSGPRKRRAHEHRKPKR